jgi:hypothetical protein
MKGAGLQAVTARLEQSLGRNDIPLSARRYGD